MMKEMLIEYRHLDAKIKEIQDEIHQFNSEMEGLREYKSYSINDMPRKKEVKDNISEKVCKIVDVYQKKIDEELFPMLIENINKKDIILFCIAELCYTEQQIILLRYKKNIKWDDIARKLHYSKSRCFMIHDVAIHKLVRIYVKKEKSCLLS